MKYKMKPTIVKAVQIIPGCVAELSLLVGEPTELKTDDGGVYTFIPTFKGKRKVCQGYYVVKNEGNGAVFIMSEDDFKTVYEKA